MATPYITREAIMSSLFTLIKGMAVMGIKFTFSRRFYMWDKVAGASMPMVMLTKGKENYPSRAAIGLPAKRTFSMELNIYFDYGKNQQEIPDIYVNNIMDAVDTVLAPPAGQTVQTLGGLVDHCYIEGDALLVPGDLDGIGHLLIPLKAVLP